MRCLRVAQSMSTSPRYARNWNACPRILSSSSPFIDRAIASWAELRAGIAVFGLKAVWAEGAPRRQRPLKVEESAGAGVEDGDFSRPRLGRGANGDTGASITARA